MQMAAAAGPVSLRKLAQSAGLRPRYPAAFAGPCPGQFSLRPSLQPLLDHVLHQRPHAAHGGWTPAVVYLNQTKIDQHGQRVA